MKNRPSKTPADNDPKWLIVRERKIPISLRFPPAKIRQCDEYAAAHGMTRVQVLRALIHQAFDKDCQHYVLKAV